jgi:hypothetical protein
MYLRGLSLAQKWQVESSVNHTRFFYPLTARPLNVTREQTLATQSYLSQHRLSSSHLKQGLDRDA